MIIRPTLPLAALLLATASYAQTAPPTLPPETPPPPAAPQFPDSPGTTNTPPPAPVPTGPTVLFDTSMGRLTCKFFDKQAPVAVANFIGLAEGTKDWTDPINQQKIHRKRFYDGTTFHRVIPAFMIQGGDRRGDGSGDAGYYFDNEVVSNLTFDTPGRLAMANAGPNTNGTQFFITELPYPDLDGKYTIFGQCDAHSVLIVATIARVERNSSDKPLTSVTLEKVTIVREGQPVPPAPATTVPSVPAATVPPPMR